MEIEDRILAFIRYKTFNSTEKIAVAGISKDDFNCVKRGILNGDYKNHFLNIREIQQIKCKFIPAY